MSSRPRGRSILVAITFLLSGTSVYAHHGRDFLLVQTSHIPEPGGFYGLTRQDYTQEEHDEVEVEVAFLFGLLDWMAVEVHGHIEKQSRESPNYESTAPAIHWRFTPRAYSIGVGASVECEFSDDDEADMVEVSGVSAFENEGWNCGRYGAYPGSPRPRPCRKRYSSRKPDPRARKVAVLCRGTPGQIFCLGQVFRTCYSAYSLANWGKLRRAYEGL